MFRIINRWLVILAVMAAPGFAREWTDSTGKYTVQADLITRDETTVVLKKEDHQLIEVPLEKLSVQDQQYLKSREASDQAHRTASEMQIWNMRDGWKVAGKVVDYGRRDVVVQRRRGKIYVNDRLFDNLPKSYQVMLPFIVSHFEQIKVENEADLKSWILKHKGEPYKFTCEGVMLELANGDELDVPFFLFSEADLKVLQPGWKQWVASANEKTKQEHQAFLLQSEAKAYQEDRQVNQQIAMLHLEMLAYNSGLFDYWQVAMMPSPGVHGGPMIVVVPARDNRGAVAAAMQQYPGYVPGSATKVSRK